MDMVRHNDVTADRDIVMVRFIAKTAEQLMYLLPRKNGAPLVSVEGHKIKWPNGGEQKFESRWTPGAIDSCFVVHGRMRSNHKVFVAAIIFGSYFLNGIAGKRKGAPRANRVHTPSLDKPG